MRTCPYCGSQISDGDPFCMKCGAYIKDQGQQQSTQQQTYNQQPYQAQQPYYGQSGPKKANWLPVLLITVIVLIAAFAGVGLLSNLITDTSGSDHTMEYSWDYYYEDDKYIHYTYSLTVPADYYSKMETSTIARGGTQSDVHLETSQGTVYAVKEYIVVDKYITQVAKDLRAMFDRDRQSTIPSSADFASFIMAFVQGSITYQTDSEYTNKQYDEYWKYPLETLCDKKGDCEDTSILIAALLDASTKSSDPSGTYDGGIFLIPGHAMGAVKTTDVSEERKVSNERFGYYPIESTTNNKGSFDGYVIGSIAPEYYGDYFHIYTGYSTAYYGVTSL